jgi:hypothetical protein
MRAARSLAPNASCAARRSSPRAGADEVAVRIDGEQKIEAGDLGGWGEELANRDVVLGRDGLHHVRALGERPHLPSGFGEHRFEPRAGKARLALELLGHLHLGELAQRAALLVEPAIEAHGGEDTDGAESRRAGDANDGGEPCSDREAHARRRLSRHFRPGARPRRRLVEILRRGRPGGFAGCDGRQ